MGTHGSVAKRAMRLVVLAALTLLVGFLAGYGAIRLAHDVGLVRPIAPTSADTDGTALAYQADVDYTAWDPLQSPNYYRVDGKAVVDVDLEPGEIRYAALDSLGRARGAVALVSYDSMMAGRERPRESLADVSPTGWGHNAEVDIALPTGGIYHGQLFNRSHLVAKSLGGDDELHNLICATRMQNVGANVQGTDGGMAYGEGLARNWLEQHPDGTVYYAATPVYEGDELVARSVVVDIQTSDGSVSQRIEVYNAALGFSIDYAKGTFTVTEPATDAVSRVREGTVQESQGEVVQDDAEQDDERLVIVTGSGAAYHYDETCSGLAQARSMRWVTVAEAKQMGRHACGICGG